MNAAESTNAVSDAIRYVFILFYPFSANFFFLSNLRRNCGDYTLFRFAEFSRSHRFFGNRYVVVFVFHAHDFLRFFAAFARD